MNKVLQNYRRSKHLSRTSTEMVASVFYACAGYMDKIEECLHSKNYYERAMASEKIVMALTNLSSLFETHTETQKNFAKDMKEFCYLILANMTEINQKQKHTLCLETRALLQEMGLLWEKI